MKSIEVDTKKFNSLLKLKGMSFGDFAKAGPQLTINTLCKLQENYPLELNSKQISLIQKALKKLKFTPKEITDVINEKTQLSLFEE